MMKYKGIDPKDTEAIKKRNLLRRKKQAATMKKNKKNPNYVRTPQERLEAAKYTDELLIPSQYDIEDPEFKIILYELDKIKLYLFDIMHRLHQLESYHTPPTTTPTDYRGMSQSALLNRNAMYKGPNANKGQDFVRKNVAQILKNMLPQATLDLMPKEVRDAYHNILSVMGAPNDPVWEKEPKPDPREPGVTFHDLEEPKPGDWKSPLPNTFQKVTDLWNNVADNMKKLDGVNLTDEIVKAANELLAEKAANEAFNETEEITKAGRKAVSEAFSVDDQEFKEEQSSDDQSTKEDAKDQ